MMTISSNWSNGKVNEHETNGRFMSKQSLDTKPCPCCGHIVVKAVQAWRDSSGFPLPPNLLRPRFPEFCLWCSGPTNEKQAFNAMFSQVIGEG